MMPRPHGRFWIGLSLGILLEILCRPVLAGPPYVSDDPEPTDLGHYEIYFFGSGTLTQSTRDNQAGVDFNYGAAPDLQLTAVIPVERDAATGSASGSGLGNVQLAAKYRFLHQESEGWDVAFFPRILLASPTSAVGVSRPSLFLPFWLEKDMGPWSTFGGGGCTFIHGSGYENSCLLSWAITREVMPDLHVGAEVFHSTPAARGVSATTGLGFGAVYDLNENIHLLTSFGPGIENAASTNQFSWYAAVLFTF